MGRLSWVSGSPTFRIAAAKSHKEPPGESLSMGQCISGDAMQRASFLRERVLRAYRVLGAQTHRDIARCGAGWQLDAEDSDAFRGLWDASLHQWSSMLHHPRASARDFAVQSLPLLPVPSIAPLLQGMLDDRAQRVRRSAYAALGACGPYARPQVSELVGRYLSLWPRSRRQRHQRQALRGCLHRLAPHTPSLLGPDDRWQTTATTERKLSELCELLRLPADAIPHRRLHSGFVRIGESDADVACDARDLRLLRLLEQLEHPALQLGLHALEELLPLGACISEDAAVWADIQARMDWYRQAFGRPNAEQRRLQEVFKECLYMWIVCGGLPLLQEWLQHPERLASLVQEEYGILLLIVFFGALCQLFSRR